MNNTIDVKKTEYKNAISYKWHNRRVTVILEDDGGFAFDFRIATDDDKVRSYHKRKGCVTATRLALSREAAELVYQGIEELLIKDKEEKLTQLTQEAQERGEYE